MMKALDINKRLFQDKTDGQVTYTGPSVPALGISTGDSLSKVLAVIVQQGSQTALVRELSDRVTNLRSDELITTAPTYDLGSASSASSAAISNKGMGYEVREEGNYSLIEYSMQDTSRHLPEGFKVVSSGVTVQGTGSNTLLISTTGTAGNLKVLPDKYPIRVNFRLGINTPDGDIILKRSETLQAATPRVRNTSLVVEDLTSPADSYITQKEFNSRMSSQISNLMQRITELERNGSK